MKDQTEMLYRSTRSALAPVTASQAVLLGLAPDGGLYVPVSIPKLEIGPEQLSAMNYRDTANEVMRLFFTDFTEEELRDCIDGAYDSKFETAEPAVLKEAGDSYYLELFHGPTIAFKDMALTILPRLMTTAAKKLGEKKEIVILTATSGDTGKAALSGFADVPLTRIMVFYPKGGVSQIQERQMVTQKGANVGVAGVRGNFDDTQTGVKRIFTDAALREELAGKGFQFSSANSINIGRLIPQVVYYVYAYGQMVKSGAIKAGELLNFTVPTGNFGNILAAWYAKQMGLPVGRLICASNENKVLFDFFRSGSYDRRRPFVLTSSPSMDILISSNLERLIFHAAGDDAEVTAQLMKSLTEDGIYDISDAMREKLDSFAAGFASEEETAAAINETFKETGYCVDPHTAVAVSVCRKYYAKSGDPAKCVIVSTASPFKFESAVMSAIGEKTDLPDLEMADKLAEVIGVNVPAAVSSLRDAPVLHDIVCGTDEMEKTVRTFLGI
ncbi:MAG: threonine synthase [Lachnospiraceae bacterium]|nr:threonine synthase [Lachnospiraceae bacterium]